MVWWGGNEAGHPGDTAAFWQHTATVTGPLVKALKADDGEVGGRGANQMLSPCDQAPWSTYSYCDHALAAGLQHLG